MGLLACVFANKFAFAKPDTASYSLSASALTHIVNVGQGGDNAFHPNELSAEPGDTISFQFWPTNHSVVRGEYTGSEACGAEVAILAFPIASYILVLRHFSFRRTS